ncbi:MAG: thiol reductant ABC exporter subunit CydC [Propionibacteriaceae bacterium]|nr:thiol reductant ABC exporter subunit CydC [Propionibacteriaceae bacterium]
MSDVNESLVTPLVTTETTDEQASRQGKGSVSDVRSLVVQLIGELPNGWGRLLGAVALSVAATGASVALLAVSAWLLSYAAEHPPALYLLVAATAVRTFGTTRGVFRYFERIVSHDVALRMQSALRMNVYDRLARTTLLGARRGDLLIRVTADVESIMDVIVRVALPFASASIVLLGTSIILGFFDFWSAAALLVCSVLAGIVLPLIAQRMSARTDASSVPARADLAQVVHASARATTDIVAYGRVEQQLAQVAEADARLRAAESKAAWTQGLAAGSQLFIMGVAVAAALVLGGHAVATGAMPGRELAVLALTPLALNESFADLAKAAQTMTHASTALRRIIELLTAPPVGVGDRVVEPVQPAETGSESDVAPAEPEAPSASAVLELDGLAIGWPNNPVIVDDLSLTVKPGQAVAVTGPSGIGKTTLAATVLGLIPPRAGELDVAPSVGYLAQDAHIFTTTISENVRIGNPFASEDDVVEALRRAGLPYLAPERIVGEDGNTLSGGEARRVALARILVISPRPALTLLDEPTEHLDAETAQKLMDDIWATTLPEGAMLVLTHDPGVVARCDREVKLGE